MTLMLTICRSADWQPSATLARFFATEAQRHRGKLIKRIFVSGCKWIRSYPNARWILIAAAYCGVFAESWLEVAPAISMPGLGNSALVGEFRRRIEDYGGGVFA